MHPCKGSSNVINKLTKHKHELGCIELESLDSDTVFTSCCSRPFKFLMQSNFGKGSGCDSVSRVVTSDTRRLQFKSSHWQNFIMAILTVICWKGKNKKRPGMAHFDQVLLTEKTRKFSHWQFIKIFCKDENKGKGLENKYLKIITVRFRPWSKTSIS